MDDFWLVLSVIGSVASILGFAWGVRSSSDARKGKQNNSNGSVMINGDNQGNITIDNSHKNNSDQ